MASLRKVAREAFSLDAMPRADCRVFVYPAGIDEVTVFYKNGWLECGQKRLRMQQDIYKLCFFHQKKS
jgi:hypothetical protein